LKESTKGKEFSTDDQLLDAIATIWNTLTFETLESVFREWMSRLSWVIDNNSEYYFESTDFDEKPFRIGENSMGMDGVRTFSHPSI
jgi:hypothetical protein